MKTKTLFVSAFALMLLIAFTNHSAFAQTRRTPVKSVATGAKPITATAAPTPAPTPAVSKTFDNAEVIKLVTAKLDEQLILDKINKESKVNFSSDADSLIALKNAGASKNLIAAFITRSSNAPTCTAPVAMTSSTSVEKPGGFKTASAQPATLAANPPAMVNPAPAKPTTVVAKAPNLPGFGWYAQVGGQIVELVPEPMRTTSSAGAKFLKIASQTLIKTDVKMEIAGATSTSKMTSGDYLYVKLEGAQRPEDFTVVSLQSKSDKKDATKGKREGVYGSDQAMTGTQTQNGVRLSWESLGGGVFRTTGIQPGEYAVIEDTRQKGGMVVQAPKNARTFSVGAQALANK